MKHEILEISDSNMAGFTWSYSFQLSRDRDRSFTLAFKQSAKNELHFDIKPATALKTGVDLHCALRDMLDAVGYDRDAVNMRELADEIADLDPVLAVQFAKAPEEIESRDEAERLAQENRNRETLRPFEAAIEAYVTRFSDEKLHYPGAGRVYPSKRVWVRAFMRQYVLAHGALPTGKHWVRVEGYSGGEHDFSSEPLT